MASEPQRSLFFSPHLDVKPRSLLTFIPEYPVKRPKIGLALSGGGANAITQIGVLQIFEEQGIEIDYIVGTSMGCIIGGLYAAGYTPYEIENLIKEFDWRKIISDQPERQTLFFTDKKARDQHLFQIRLDGWKPNIPPALTPGQQIESILTNYVMQADFVSSKSFDELRIPFRAVTTDLISGKKVVLNHGNLAEAMRASISFPLLFAPVQVDSMLLVDGGISSNIPVEDLSTFPVDIKIAVDATSNLRNGEQLQAPWEIADQVTSIMQVEQNQMSRERADFIIRTEDSTRTNMDFNHIGSLVALGRSETLKLIPKIKKKYVEISQGLHDHNSHGTYIIHQVNNFPAAHTLAANGGYPLLSAPVSLSHEAIQDIVESLHETGYYHSIKARLDVFENDSSKLTFSYTPMPVLKKIVFHGNRAIASDSLQRWITPIIGTSIHHQKTQAYLRGIIEKYHGEGYSLAKIVHVVFDHETNIGQVYMEEGNIQRIQIEGAKRTLHHVILREFPLKSGDIYNHNRAQRGINNIFGTGLFSRVSLSLEPKGSEVIVILKLQEKFYNVLAAAGRFDLERKGRGFIDLADENIGGIGGQLSLQGLFGVNDWGGKAGFSVDRIFKTNFSFQMEAYWLKERNKVYEKNDHSSIGKYYEERIGAKFSVGQLLRRFGILTAELHEDQFNLTEIEGRGFDSGVFTINRIALRSIVDTRNRLPFPEKGRYAHFYYETSVGTSVEQPSFVRLAGELESYFTILDRHTLHPRFSFATADGTTPFIFQYYLSGPKDMYGLKHEEWRGRNFVLGNLEYRYQLFNQFSLTGYLGLRYDFGGIWETAEEVQYDKEFKNAVGVYLGFRSLLGAIKFSYGFLDKEHQRFYFSVGYPL